MAYSATAFRLEIKGITAKHLDKYTREQFPKVVVASQVSALNKTVTKIRGRSVKSISKASKVKPQKLIKNRTYVKKASKRRISAFVSFRYPSMPVEAMGGKAGVKWRRSWIGAKVKSKTFPGTFGAVPSRGKNARKAKRVYSRVLKSWETGDNAKDLVVERISLKPYKKILGTVGKRVTNQILEKHFLDQWKWRHEKALAKLQAKAIK